MSGVVAIEFQDVSVPCGIAPRGTLRKRAETCCVCKENQVRTGQRTCKSCHSDLMRDYRKGLKGGNVLPITVDFKDLAPGEARMLHPSRMSKYEAIRQRISKLKAGSGFRAKLPSHNNARSARVDALKFAEKQGIEISTSVVEETLEVFRSEEKK